MTTFADLGNWPSTEIGAHGVIRHAYENVLTACARLASFATGGTTTTDGPIAEQQEILAVDDLATFALHARRLIENTATASRFRHVMVRRLTSFKNLIDLYEMSIYRRSTVGVSITRVLNVVIHHKSLDIVRNIFQAELLMRRYSMLEVLTRYSGDNRYFSPFVFVRSDKNQTIAFEIKELIETFQAKVLNPIIELCGEQRLYLDQDMDW